MIVALAVALGAVSSVVSGFGFALICGPALVAALGRGEGVRLTLLLSVVVNLAVLIRERGNVAWRTAALLAVPAVVTTPLFVLLLDRAPTRLGEALAGAAALLGAGVVAAGVQWPAAAGRHGAVGAGVVSAAMNVAAGISGPPVALWADNAGWSGPQLRGTLQVYFLALNAVALVGLGLPDGDRLTLGVGALAVGVAVGAVLVHRISPAVARRVTLLLAAAGGLAVLVRAAA